MSWYLFANIHMLVFGIGAITLIASRPSLQRWGFVIGLWNQWAWYYITIHDESWGLVGMNALYTINYIRAIKRYWSQGHAVLHTTDRGAGGGDTHSSQGDAPVDGRDVLSRRRSLPSMEHRMVVGCGRGDPFCACRLCWPLPLVRRSRLSLPGRGHASFPRMAPSAKNDSGAREGSAGGRDEETGD